MSSYRTTIFTHVHQYTFRAHVRFFDVFTKVSPGPWVFRIGRSNPRPKTFFNTTSTWVLVPIGHTSQEQEVGGGGGHIGNPLYVGHMLTCAHRRFFPPSLVCQTRTTETSTSCKVCQGGSPRGVDEVYHFTGVSGDVQNKR